MQKPVNRILAALELLQAQPRLNGADLANRLGVARRTVRRYVETLESIGVPIITERGRDGGYALVRGYKLPPMMFSSDEAVALSIGLRAARQLGLADIGSAAASAQAKLERVMPETTRVQTQAIGAAVVLELTKTTATENPQILTELATAARRRQRLTVSYLSAAQVKTIRDFDTYAVAHRGGHWYAVGYCHLRCDLRALRLDRIALIVARAASFKRPADFDVLRFLTESIANLPRAYDITVELHTEIAVARSKVLAELATLEIHKGGVRLHAQADDLNWFARELARLPFAFRVVRPLALRKAVRLLGQQLIAQSSAAGVLA